MNKKILKKLHYWTVWSFSCVIIGVVTRELIEILLDNYRNVENYAFQFNPEGITIILIIVFLYTMFSLIIKWAIVTERK